MTPSKRLPRADELDGVGDSFAAHRRSLHAFAAMVIPSEMETVLNSIGVPPASRIPSFSATASCATPSDQSRVPIRSRCLATPTMRLARILVGKYDRLQLTGEENAVGSIGDSATVPLAFQCSLLLPESFLPMEKVIIAGRG